MATELFPAGAPDVLYLVDLSSYVLRAYHAIAPLSNAAGEPTHAVHGTVSMLERLLRERRPALFGIAMDSGRSTFRKEIYDGYKANRPPAPDDLRQQLQRVEQVVRAFNVAILKLDGVEADDLIACSVKQARARGLRVVVVASDKDLMQLVGPDVVLYDTMRDRVFGVPEVEERFGVRVDQLRDLLALTGDSSDNIPGVPSVGPKTAKDLLVEYGTLVGVYEHLEQIQRKALREALTNNKELAFISQRLVTLKDDCWDAFDPAEFARRPRDVATLRTLYTELGFQRQLGQLDNEPTVPVVGAAPAQAQAEPEPIVPVAGPNFELVRDEAGLENLVARIASAGRCAVEVFTDVPRPARGRVVGVSLSVEPGSAVYLPVGHRHMVSGPQLPLSLLKEKLGPLLADRSIRKLGLDLKNSAVAGAREGLPIAGFSFDATLASYLLDPEGRHDRESLAQRELGMVAESYDELTKRGRTKLAFDELSPDEALSYAASSAHFAMRLEQRLQPRLAEDSLQKLFDEVELPLAELLTQLELRGVRIDTGVLAAIGKDCETELARLEKEAERVAGRPFNVNSPRQLETLLFDEFGLKPLKRTKTSRSTDAATLEALADQHELPRIILEIRQLSKLKGTYIDALPALVQRDTLRIHGSWEQAVAATGRLSSSDPNLQNIPIRSELGRKIRAAFTAPPEHELVSADYSQIELRVLAHLSQDPVLLDAFRTGQDIHTRTAMEIFEVDAASVTREHRTRAKAVNFGVIYGQGDSGLAKVLGISRAEASSFIAAYFRRYEGVRRFMNETLEHARAGLAVKTLFGRRRLVPNIGSANRAERLAAERIAMNMPIQGTAADILKFAMLALAEPVTPGTKMVLTVHDELVFEVPTAEVDAALPAIRAKMENAVKLDVPLEVDVGHGADWNAAH
jgi:DNA polymerase-1